MMRRRSTIQPLDSTARERIQRAAAELFAERGHHEASIRDIARRAGMNSQLIYHYFADKRGLWRAVAEEAAGKVRDLLRDALDRPGTPTERLRGFIDAWVRFTLAEAPTIRMLFRMTQDADAVHVALVRRHAGANMALVVALMEEGMAAGDFRRDLEPRLAAASLAGMVFFLATSGPIVLPAAGVGRASKATERLARHTAALFLRGIAADARRGRRT